jgi:pilus assembly protein Flp/PilA
MPAEFNLGSWCNDETLRNGKCEKTDFVKNHYGYGRSDMRNFTQKLVTFLKKEDGPTAVEYAVMLALIIVVCIAAITTIGKGANSTFANVATNLPTGATT